MTLLCLVCTGLASVAGYAQMTESPETVAPGRFLLEMDALSLTVDKNGGTKYTGIGAASTLLSTGLSANWDIQVGGQLFLSQQYEQGGFKERNSGAGDLYVRTKWRLFKDAERGVALAVMPYVKLPTNSGGVGNRSVEGGLIVPWTSKLFGEWSLGAMVELDVLRNGADDGFDTAWFASAAASRQFTKTLGGYVEVAAGKTSGRGAWASSLGGGITFAISEQAWWDLAVYRGISRDAADWSPVIRFNWGF